MDTLKELAFVFGWVALSLLLVQIFISAGRLTALRRLRDAKSSVDERSAALRSADK